MPRLLGLRVSFLGLAVRIVGGLLASMFAFAVLFYLPMRLPSTLSGLLVTRGPIGSELFASLISPRAPTLGLPIVVLVFAGVLLMGTRVYGPVLVLNGIAFAGYVYALFEGGLVQVSASGNLLGATDATVSLSVNMAAVFVAFLLPPLLTIVKGVMLMRSPPPGTGQGLGVASENS